MSALRDLVGGGAGASCAAPDERVGSSNPLGRLADAVLGDRKGKHPETRRAPNGAPGAFADQFLSEQRLQGNLLGMDDPSFSALPGGAHPGMLAPGAGDVAEFLRFRDQHQHGPVPGGPEHGFSQMPSRTPEHPALARALRSAVASADPRSVGAAPPMASDLALSPAEKTVIRARSAIMARHLHSDAHEGAVHTRLLDALSPLGVDPAPSGAMDGPRQFHGPQNAQGVVGPGPHFASAETAADARRRFVANGTSAQGWADDIARLQVRDGHTATAVPGPGGGAASVSQNRPTESWAEEFSGVKQSAGVVWAEEFHAPPSTGNAWAEEFRQEQETASRNGQTPLSATQLETAAQSGRVADTLRNDPSGKFANSQFLQFMSRMSHGEIVVEDNEVHETGRVGLDEAHGATGTSWANEFSTEQARNGGWATEFNQPGPSTAFGAPPPRSTQATLDGAAPTDSAHRWADEFADFASGDWAAEFQELASRGEAGEWSHDSVWNAITEESNALKNADRLHYEFMNPNPYLGRPDCLSIGRDLFRRGVLSEAALALEAAVRADSNFCEGWRLLSTVHAENDDDRRAIAAATKAHEADPTDLEALLSLGVSHTNELDQAEATGYMRAWLKHQPRFAHLEAQHSSQFANNPEQGNTPAATLELFKRAAATAPRDADVHAVLGVLAHLGRSYDKAIDAFNNALDINPNDYSLWNKLGATQANSARSADAMAAYQRALDLKPNYVRAWANMGIGFANQGKYEQSCGFYTRALSLNPHAESVWGYLRISLGCCGRIDLMEAVDRQDLERLQREFPL